MLCYWDCLSVCLYQIKLRVNRRPCRDGVSSSRTYSQPETVLAPSCIAGPWPSSCDMSHLNPVQSNLVFAVFNFRQVLSRLDRGIQSAMTMLPLKRGQGVANSFNHTPTFDGYASCLCTCQFFKRASQKLLHTHYTTISNQALRLLFYSCIHV